MQNAIEVTGLCNRYPDFSLENVSFTVPSGSIVGLIGENGAGKTTTLRAILGALHPDSGTVSLLGKSPADASVKQHLGVVFSDAFFPEILTARQIGQSLAAIQPGFDRAYWQQLLERFALPEKKQLKDLSLGMRSKLRLATALCHHPSLLILDEATSGLDPVMRSEVLDILWDFIQDEGHSVLLSTHITSDLEKIADSIVLVHKGRVLFQKDAPELLENYGVLRASSLSLDRLPEALISARRTGPMGAEALVNNRHKAAALLPDAALDKATLEDIMCFLAGRNAQ